LWFTVNDVGRYSDVFRAHLAAGFLLNPDPEAPSLVPTALSAGEWAAWTRAAEAAQEAL
jgi:hypothetical protein